MWSFRLGASRSSLLQCSRPRAIAVRASNLRIASPLVAKSQLLPQPQLQAADAGVSTLKPPPVRRVPPPAQPSAANKQHQLRMAAARQAAVAAAAQQSSRRIKLAVVGDVHSQWDADSEAALCSLGADVAVFVGDFGEENLQLIQRIADIPHPKAVILGNHDAWFSLTRNGRQRYARAMMASSSLAMRQQQGFSEGGSTPTIAAQLQLLGDDHLGFASKTFPSLGLTLLGGRPFSKGGKQWSDVADFYSEHYGVGGHQDSALRILDVALAAPEDDLKVLVAHNGPAGLGGRRHNICGVDWTEPEADFGDPDLQEALDMMAAQGLRTPLVLFGHMHSQLKGSGLRNMVEVDPATGTVYLNAATVPRIRSLPVPSHSDGSSGGTGSGTGSSSSGSEVNGSQGGDEERLKGHHFLVVELQHGVVAAARDVWVGVQHTASGAAAAAAAAAEPPCSNGGNSSSPSDGASSSRRCIVLREQELVKTSLATASAAAAGGDGARAAAAGSAEAAAAGAAVASRGDAAGAVAEGSSESGAYVCSIYRAHTKEWEPFVLHLAPLAAAAAAEAQLAECC